jgi:ABC-type sugar transport system substrate-binding protein
MKLASDGTTVIILVILFLVSLACFLVVNNLAVIYRRKFLHPTFIVSTLTFFILCVVVLNYFGYSFSDTLAVVGLVATFLFGFAGTRFLQRRQETLAILAITSKSRFIEELRKGFYNNLGDVPIKVEDVFAGSNSSESFEDLPALIPTAQKAELLRPDYLIILPHSKLQADSRELASVLSRLTKRGGRVIVMQNPPENINSYKGMVTCIYSDVTEGARIIAAYAVATLAETSTVLLLNGPGYSPPAQTRKKIIMSELEQAHHNIISQDLPGWTEEGAYLRANSFLHDNPAPDLIICGNDTMAFGAVRAVREFAYTKRAKPIPTKVFGYDGLTRAIISIADKDSPFYATVRIPPYSYGKIAANIIRAEVGGIAKPRSEDTMRKISIDGTNLVTKENADRILDYL